MLETLKYFLFGNKGTLPICKRHGGLSRAEKEAYNHWVLQKTYLNWTPNLFKAYHFDKAGIRPDYKLERIQQACKNGVIFSYDDRIGVQNFKFLYEFIKDQVLQLGYRLHCADIRKCQKNGFPETIHKYYLTPPPSCLKESSICNQLYGTISVDLILIETQPAFIRIITNSYLSCDFSQALPFDELLNRILNNAAIVQ